MSESLNNNGGSSNSPPESPFHRRAGSMRGGDGSYESNVFSRLTSESLKQSPKPETGHVKAASTANTSRFRQSPVALTHVASGHSKARYNLELIDFLLLLYGSKGSLY